MRIINPQPQRQPGNRLQGVLALGLALLLAACEAPLNLEQVEAENAREQLRYDMLQAAAHSGNDNGFSFGNPSRCAFCW